MTALCHALTGSLVVALNDTPNPKQSLLMCTRVYDVSSQKNGVAILGDPFSGRMTDPLEEKFTIRSLSTNTHYVDIDRFDSGGLG